jgi:ferredoxin-NADP reductase
VLLTLPIRDVLRATPRARIVRLDLNRHPFPYVAGQAVLIASHGHERRRPYSIASAPEDAIRDRTLELLIGVDDTGNPGDHLTLHHGTLVDVDGPVGRFTFPDHPAERRFIFIAGGTGIAPLRAMLRHALAAPHDEIGVLYSARTPSDFAYEGELRQMADEGLIELRQTITRDVSVDQWSGTRGRIRRTDLAPLVHDRASLCFICGPPTLVQEMLTMLGELGVDRRRIRTEEWS